MTDKVLIYKIINRKSKKWYTGWTENSISATHVSDVNRSNSKWLESTIGKALKTDGEKSFVWESIRIVPRIDKEKWIEKWKGVLNDEPKIPLDDARHEPRRESTKKHMSESHKGLKHSEETKQKMSESRRARTWEPKKSQESIEKQREKVKGVSRRVKKKPGRKPKDFEPVTIESSKNFDALMLQKFELIVKLRNEKNSINEMVEKTGFPITMVNRLIKIAKNEGEID